MIGWVLVFAAATAAPDPLDQDQTPGGRLYACSIRTTSRLEISGAEPQDIATAVIAKCDKEVGEVARSIGGADPQYHTIVATLIRDRTVAQVIEIRAARASKK